MLVLVYVEDIIFIGSNAATALQQFFTSLHFRIWVLSISFWVCRLLDVMKVCICVNQIISLDFLLVWA